jgi:superkiller protein 3
MIGRRRDRLVASLAVAPLLLGLAAGRAPAQPPSSDAPSAGDDSTDTRPVNSPAPSPEELAENVQALAVHALQTRLASASALDAQARGNDAAAEYRAALAMQPNFVALAAQSGSLNARRDALQEQIFKAQKAHDFETVDSLATTLVSLDRLLTRVRQLLDLQPAFADAHANLARLLVQEGAPSEGLAQYAQAIQLRPALAGTLRAGVARAHLAEADRRARLSDPGAAAEYQEAARLAPESGQAQFGLGSALLAKGRAAEAQAALTEAIRLRPNDAQAALMLGMALYQGGRREEAHAQWRRYAQGRDAAAADQARAMMARYPVAATPAPGEPAESAEIRRYREQVRDYPYEAYAHNNLGLALYHQKRRDEALTEVQEALRLDPKSLEARNNLGMMLRDGGQDDQAELQYKRALKLDSDNAAVHNNLGIVYFNRQQWKAAEGEFRKALEVEHADSYAHHNLANALFQQGRLAEAARECGKALRYDPAFGPAYAVRGLIEDRQGRADAGAADLLRAASLAPDKVQAALDLAEELRQVPDHALAADQYARLLRDLPDSAGARDALGGLLLSAERPAEAAAQFRAALRVGAGRAASSDSDGWRPAASRLHLAVALLRLDRNGEAAGEAREAVRLDPRLAPAFNALGTALYRVGRRREARQQWQAALTLCDPEAAHNAAGLLREFPE